MSLYEIRDQDREQRADRRRDPSFPLIPAGSGTDKHLRFEALWFEDGNVVIVAGDLRLKLHRTILSRYSTVFKDMFQVADPDTNHSYEGCPVVQVTDNPQDLILFFDLLYDGARHPFFLVPQYLLDFHDLRALTLLSFKYDVAHIQKEVHRRLQVCFPASLKRWDERYPGSCTPSGLKPGATGFAQDTIAFNPIDAIAVVNLARRFNFDTILPTAFYICSMLPMEDIVAQLQYGHIDGSVEIEQLSSSDLFCCLRGLEYYSQRSCFVALITNRRLYSAVDSMRRLPLLCSKSMFSTITSKVDDECCNAWYVLTSAFHEQWNPPTRDILYNTAHWLWVHADHVRGESAHREYALCFDCITSVTSVLQRWREDRWTGLSNLFEL